MTFPLVELELTITQVGAFHPVIFPLSFAHLVPLVLPLILALPRPLARETRLQLTTFLAKRKSPLFDDPHFFAGGTKYSCPIEVFHYPLCLGASEIEIDIEIESFGGRKERSDLRG